MRKTKLFTLLFLAIIWGLSLKFSLDRTDSELLNSFSKSKESAILHTITGFNTSKKALVYIPFDMKDAENVVVKIADEMKQSGEFNGVFYKLTDANEEIKEYFKNNYIYLSDANLSKFGNIENELKKLKEKSENPFEYTPIDKSDPFGVFTLKTAGFEHKNGMLSVAKGYLIIASTKADITDQKAAIKLEETCKKLEQKYTGSLFFAPHFFSAENSQIIEKKVKTLSIISILALIGIYVFILKNPRLLAVSVVVLGFSISVASAVTALIFGHIATLALAFGAGIASIAEDYLFLLYLKRNFQTNSFNKEVFFGFLATFLSLLTLSTLSDGLVAQISLFTASAIAVAYICFSYLPRFFDFSKQVFFAPLRFRPKAVINPYILTLFATLVLFASIFYAKADFEIQKLNYDNKELNARSAFFESMLGDKESIIIEAKTKDELLKKTDAIKQKFPSLNSISDFIPSKESLEQKDKNLKSIKIDEIKQKIEQNAQKNGFRAGYFANSYDFLKNPNFIPNEKAVSELGYEIKCNTHACYTSAQIKQTDINNVKSSFDSIYTTREIIIQMAKTEFKSFAVPSILAALVVICVLIYKSRQNFIFALNFILFPLSALLFYLAFIAGGVNIMHMFGIFLVVIYGVDYGIYLEKDESDEALRAVFYSLSTTFAGFGVLAFSDIVAVSSIGIAVCIGILTLFAAIFQKRVINAN